LGFNFSDYGYWQRNGYKSNLFALVESGGFAVQIFPLLIFNQRYEPQSKLWTQKEARFARTSYPAAELRGIL